MFGIGSYTTMTAAYLQYCVLCFICSELKQINHKVFSVTDQQRYPGLAGTLDSLSFLSLSLSRLVLLASCESVQPVSMRHLGCIGPVREERRGAAGTYQSPRDQQICSVYLGFDLS